MPWVNNRWVPEDDSSVTKLNAMTATDSPYIKLARNSAAETSNSRGLINSSIAAGAGEAAAIAAAAPFAINDSQLTGQKNLSFEQAGQASDQSAQESRQASSLSAQQADQAIKAQREAQGAASGLSAQEYTQQTGLVGLQGQQARDLANVNNTAQASQVDKQLASTASIATANNAAEMERARAQLASSERTNATNQLLNSDANYLSAFGSIAANENIPAPTRDAYLANILAIRQGGQDAVQQMYGISLNWAPAPAPAAPASTPAANSNSGGTAKTIAKTALSPVSTKTGRGLLTTGLSSLF